MQLQPILLRNHKVTDRDIVEYGDDTIASVVGCYPPNVVDVIGSKVYYYHGLEEGFMCWDVIDKRKLKKEIKRSQKVFLKHK